jgi:hypothetical protein
MSEVDLWLQHKRQSPRNKRGDAEERVAVVSCDGVSRDRLLQKLRFGPIVFGQIFFLKFWTNINPRNDINLSNNLVFKGF